MNIPSTPNKRRRQNNFQPSPQPVRSLDFFFGRLQQESSTTKDDEQTDKSAALTDEEFARQIQTEWNADDAKSGQVVRQEDCVSLQQMPEEGNAISSQTVEEVELISLKPGEVKNLENKVDEPDTISSIKKSLPLQSLAKDESSTTQPNSKNFLSLQSTTAVEDTISHDIPFDDPPLTFDPQKYLPELHKQWAKENGNSTYALLTHCFVLVNSTQSRIKIVNTLVNLIRTIIEGDPTSLLPAVWLATNSISPPYIDLELGLGGSAISKALKKVYGLDNARLKKLYDQYGDAGDVAFEAKKRQAITLRKPKPLTMKGVFDSLVKIANAKGHGSQEVKQRIVERLVQDARGAEESRYVVRTLVQHLRIGAVKTTMLIALSRAFLLSRPPDSNFSIKDRSQLANLSKQELAELWQPAEELVKASFARHPNYNDLVPTLLEIGIDEELVVRCGLAMHIPLRPMLGGITRDLGDMLTKLHGREFACEFKYDGQRAQIHCDSKGKVTIFSRHLEDMTDKYPDLVGLVPKIRGEGVRSFIIEGEVVAIDQESGHLKPFQVLANRARKDVVIQSVKVDVCLFAFDVMYLNGEELLNRTFRERRSLLRSLFIEIPYHFTWAKSIDAVSTDDDAVAEFFQQATNIKCEGIMVKVLDNLKFPDLQPEEEEVEVKTVTLLKKRKKKKKPGDPEGVAEKKGGQRKALLATYEPDKRLDSWLKVKKDYNTTFDTIDLIPVGAWHGQGRKCNWWSPILLACRNEETGQLEVVTKCISGFTDAFYKTNKEKYHEDGPNTISRPSYIEYGGHPDVWFEPQEVWEMAFADITLSPTYTAAIGLVSDERGLSMRFPRFLKVREDKSIEEASTNDFLASLYRKQEAKAPSVVDDEDQYDE